MMTGTGFKAFGPFLMPLLCGETCTIKKSLSFARILSMKALYFTQVFYSHKISTTNKYTRVQIELIVMAL